jgi:transposase InsO family protein
MDQGAWPSTSLGGKPIQNGRIGSFNGRLRDEFLNETLFTSLAQTWLALEEWRRDDNNVRRHFRIGWLAPGDCRSFQRWEMLNVVELSFWKLVRSLGLRYPELCTLRRTERCPPCGRR